MRLTIKFLLISSLIAIIGYETTAQEDIKEISNFEHSFIEPPEKEWGEDHLREFNRWFAESQEKGRLKNQAFFDNLKVPEDNNVRLQYTIRMNRPRKYKLGEPIFVRDYVENLSNYIVIIIGPLEFLFSINRISLVDADGNDVPMTDAGKQMDKCIKNSEKVVVSAKGIPIFLSPQNLNPQHERKLKPGPIVLNHYFDMTRPGVYQLTFHRISFYEGQKYDEPLSSNTLTIEVTEEFVTPEDMKNPGEFIFPPPEATLETEPESSDEE